MKIDNIKDLEAVVKMCNKHGVSSITVDGVTMQLSGPPDLKTEQSLSGDGIKTPDQFTPEQILMWSSSTEI